MLPELRKKINKRNKTRARTMEQRVARKLKGNRVPMSGAGTLKGDCFIPVDEYRQFYVECKLTQADKVRIPQQWFFKIQKEAAAMRCYFGVLVVHFVGRKIESVFIPEHGVKKLEQLLGENFSENAENWDTEYSTGGIVLRDAFFYNHTLTWMTFEEGNWLLIPITALAEILDRIREPYNNEDIIQEGS